MAQETSISWTDLSWNPTHGCSKVSPGCANCYAETLSLRYGQTPAPWTPANAVGNVLLKPHKLREPLSNAKAWRGLGAAAAAAGKTDGKLVFVNSMSDLFHEQIPDEYIADVFAVMAIASRHAFQVLTKRPERMRALLTSADFEWAVRELVIGSALIEPTWPLPNAWLGVSIENRRFVHRADVLRETPAVVRFISAEPLLGPLLNVAKHTTICGCGQGEPAEHEICLDCGDDVPGCSCDLDLTGIDWLIVGGESGAGHRPMRAEWVRDLREYCRHSRHLYDPATDRRGPGTAFFLKQMGGHRPGDSLEALPEDLRIREFPRARGAA